jgi:hypothetical protein
MLRSVTQNAVKDIKSLAFMFYEDESEKTGHLTYGADLITFLNKAFDNVYKEYSSY